jgi:hypothetical protein
MIGTKYNKWTVISDASKDKWGAYQYKCQCDCGTINIIRRSDLASQKSLQCRSCGYKNKRQGIPKLKSPIAGKGNNYKHGMNKSRTYSSWASMINRCSGSMSGKNYKWYGIKGIKVCESWLKFECFYRDMGKRPLKTILDRIDNNKGYEPGNCRWATYTESSRNRDCCK